ncbi:hypothetical protein [Aquimarina longa]|uniref:hypothetical protein n=1 Tax=Aquimarina longa TaxID=1080221 RepID=UPI000A689D79|nr:hypothetical protein [Aquimarina longa]
MVTFLIILTGLVAFNFILLKISTQSVDTDKKKSKTSINKIEDKKSKESDISNAA